MSLPGRIRLIPYYFLPDIGMIPSVSTKELSAIGFTVGAAFFTLMGYELVRTSAMVLFKQTYSAASLPVVMALMPLGVLLGLHVYGWLLSWLGPRRTLLVTTLSSGVLLGLCYVALLQGFSWVTAILFIFKEFYIVLLIEQYWSFINSSITQNTAKKLNGPILGFSAIASAVGGFFVFGVAEKIGTLNLLLFPIGLLLPAAICSQLAYRWAGEPQPTLTEAKEQERGGYLELRQFKLHPLLLALLGIVLATQVLATLMELRFQMILSEEFTSIDQEAAFQGKFFGSLQLLILLTQFALTPLLLTNLSLRVIHLVIPSIHILTCILAIFFPSLSTIGLSFFLFKAFDYSLFRAVKEILYIPLSFNVRYRAKEFIDVFGYRCAKGFTSSIVIVAKKIGLLANSFYMIGALLAAIIWFLLIFPLLTEAKKERVSF